MGQEPDPWVLADLCSDTRGLENTVKIPGFQAPLQARDTAAGEWPSFWSCALVFALWLKW